MEASVWSSYFVDLSPEEMVKTFSGKGWFKSELSDEHAFVLLGRGQAEKEGRRFKEFAEGYGVSFPQGHLWLKCDIAAVKQDEVIDELKRWLELFNAIGIRNAVLHPGGRDMMSLGHDPESILEAQVRALKELSEFIKDTGMYICLENMHKHFSQCEELLDLIRAVDASNIAICLDTGHLNLIGGNQDDFIRKAGTLLKALHIADNEGKYDQHMMPFGRGTVAWDTVVSALKETGYSGLFNLEIPGERDCPLPVRLMKLDYIKQVVSFLI